MGFMKKKKTTISKEKLEQYDLLIAEVTGMARKGVTLPYTSMNGNMYTMMRKDGTLGIRLSDEDRQSFMEEYDTIPFENYGAMIKEYVEVPDRVFMDTDLMIKYLSMSHEYAKLLKAKATTKEKGKKKKEEDQKEKKSTDNVGERYKNGQVKADIEGDILTHYFENGSMRAQGKVLNDKMEGKWIFNKKNGSLWQIGNFSKDMKDGEFIRYDSKGEIAYHVEFKDGKLIKKLSD